MSELVKAEAKHIAPLAIRINDFTTGELYLPEPKEDYPSWLGFFDGYLTKEDMGKDRSRSAALIVKFRKKHFAFTFGHQGRFLLNQDLFEENFGLRVALNSVAEDGIRRVAKHSLDPLFRHSDEHATIRHATVAEFGFDIEQDLLRGITGKPSNDKDKEILGSRITGANSLHLEVGTNVNGLPSLLDCISDKWNDNSYKTKFEWIDHISEVTSLSLQEALDSRLIETINSKERESIWMAPPPIDAWDKISTFRFVAAGQNYSYGDVQLSYFSESIGGCNITLELLNTKRIVPLDEDGNKLAEWKAYQCLYAELEYEGKCYLLTGGHWYAASKNFMQSVDEAYEDIHDYKGTFPNFKHPTEAKYLIDVHKTGGGNYALMDQRFPKFSGKMEFCDLYTKAKDICHIKRYGQASAMSHLFAQGLASGHTFKLEPKFREAVNKLLPSGHKISDVKKDPEDREYQIVFAIVTHQPGKLKLPFLARLTFKNAAKELGGLGYRVAKAKIEYDANFLATKKCKPPRRKA